MTIEISTWVIPLVVTIGVFAYVFSQHDGDDYMRLFTVPLAGFISLIVWLIWALLR